MEIMYLGPIVLQRRNDLGLSQEIVCEGLCTPMTLSRFEKRQQTPSRDCVVAILQRLDLPHDRYFAQLTRREMKLRLLRKKVRAYNKSFEHTLGEERQQARLKALKTLQKMERCIKKDDRINKQFILGMRSALEDHSPQERLDMLMTAIHLTSPRFDLNKIDSCLYCVSEVIIISRIAITLANCGQRGKAIDIYAQLLKLLQKRSFDFEHLSMIAFNYALQLASDKQVEEALKISKFGREICINQGLYYLLPKFLHIEADCYYFMNELDRSVELYQSAYHIYGAIGDITDQKSLKTDAEERFGLIF